MQTQPLALEVRSSASVAKAQPAAAPQVPLTSVRRFFGTLALAHRKGPEGAQSTDWSRQTVDSWFLLLRRQPAFTLNSAREAASDGVVLTGEAFSSFKWD
jgi:hypothetical protein